jgi:hypothetical protein
MEGVTTRVWSSRSYLSFSPVPQVPARFLDGNLGLGSVPVDAGESQKNDANLEHQVSFPVSRNIASPRNAWDRPFCFALDTILAPHAAYVQSLRFRTTPGAPLLAGFARGGSGDWPPYLYDNRPASMALTKKKAPQSVRRFSSLTPLCKESMQCFGSSALGRVHRNSVSAAGGISSFQSCLVLL